MKPIWQKVKAQAEAYRNAGMPTYECTKKAIPTMTKSEAIALLNDAIDTVKSCTASIKAIRGSQRDPDCIGQIKKNTHYITCCMNEISLYEKSTDEKFQSSFPTTTLVSIFEAVPSLVQFCDYFVARGPRFNPK